MGATQIKISLLNIYSLIEKRSESFPPNTGEQIIGIIVICNGRKYASLLAEYKLALSIMDK